MTSAACAGPSDPPPRSTAGSPSTSTTRVAPPIASSTAASLGTAPLASSAAVSGTPSPPASPASPASARGAASPASPAAPAAIGPPVSPAIAAALAKLPPNVDVELATIAITLCAATYRDGEVGCRRPLPFKGRGRAPDGTIPRHTGEVTTFCQLRILGRGAFTKPNTREIAIAIENCFDPTDGGGWNGSLPGSLVVVADGHVVAEQRGVQADCRSARRQDGREALLCRSGYAAGSIGSMTSFFSIDFARKKRIVTFARLYGDADTFNCMLRQHDPVLAPDGLTSLTITNVDYADTNGDGIPDVAIDVTRVNAKASPALEARLRASCKKSSSADVGTPTPTRLEALSSGDGWTPTAATKALLDAWEANAGSAHQLDEMDPGRAK